MFSCNKNNAHSDLFVLLSNLHVQFLWVSTVSDVICQCNLFFDIRSAHTKFLFPLSIAYQNVPCLHFEFNSYIGPTITEIFFSVHLKIIHIVLHIRQNSCFNMATMSSAALLTRCSLKCSFHLSVLSQWFPEWTESAWFRLVVDP